VQGDHLAFTRNSNYWQAGRPFLDAMQVPIRAPQTGISQLEAGALDAVMSPSVGDFVRLKADPAYAAIQHPNPGTFLELGINVTRQPFDNKQLRQALNYAIDRNRLANQIYQGTSVPGALPWSASAPAYDQMKSSTSYMTLVGFCLLTCGWASASYIYIHVTGPGPGKCRPRRGKIRHLYKRVGASSTS
jgi:ABC-type transport system substrate-binding protein